MSNAAAWLLLIVIPLGAEPLPKAAAPPDTDIAAAARRLGSDDSAERDAATKVLATAGESARQVLQTLARSEDAEVAQRAGLLLDRLDWEISPDAPDEALLWVRTFEASEDSRKSEPIRKLRALGQRRTALKLIRTLPSPIPSYLRHEAQLEWHAGAIDAIAAGNLAEAEQCLREKFELSDADSLRYDGDLLAFLVQTGKVDAEIERLRREPQRAPRSKAFESRLLSARGDDRAAIDLLADVDVKWLREEAEARRHDWAALAARPWYESPEIEGNGFAAVFHRRAGQKKKADQAVAGLFAVVEAEPGEHWMAAECAMIADYWDEAGRMLALSPQSQFEFLCSEMRFAEALQAAGLDLRSDPPQPWFAQPPQQPLTQRSPETNRFYFALQVLPVLRRLGEYEAADRLTAELTALRFADDNLRPRAGLIRAALRAGQTREAERLALEILVDEANVVAAAEPFYPRKQSAAEAVWQWLRSRSPDAPPAELWPKLRQLMTRTAPPPLGRDELAAMATAYEAHLGNSPSRSMQANSAVAEFCLRHDDFVAAAFYRERQAAATTVREIDGNSEAPPPPRMIAYQQAGDLHARRKAWPEAAAAYEKAWNVDRRFPLPAYLYGRTLVELGDRARGEQWMRIAELLPLGNPTRRETLAEGFDQLGLDEAAEAQRELNLRVGIWYGWTDTAMMSAQYRVAQRIDETDPARACELWRHAMLYGIHTESSIGFDDYRLLSSKAHAADARKELAAKNYDAAVAAVRAALRSRPANTDAMEEFVPKLAAAGRKADADAIFDTAFDLMSSVCRDFPRSALDHNNLAWMAAQCDRRLDDALRHAETAVTLKPDHAAYLDTLAEVCFRRGDRERAVSTAERALRIDPDDKHLANQLARFKAANQ